MNKYMEAFGKLDDMRGGLFTLTGDLVIVKLFDEQVRTKSGIYMAEQSNQIDGVNADKPTLAKVLLVGEGYHDEDDKPIPLDVSIGDVIMVGKHSVSLVSKFGGVLFDKVGIIRADQIQMRFKGQDAFDKAVAVLSEALG